MKEISEKKISDYVKEAIEIEKKGLKITPTRTKTEAIPELFASALKSNKQLKAAFEKLTPGRQKEYLQYLNEAKQEATKLKRLEKIKPMILEGTGLNDRFK
jgi:uncharacterized protein YdeI (YjbR/CyaY-like superfamily)